MGAFSFWFWVRKCLRFYPNGGLFDSETIISEQSGAEIPPEAGAAERSAQVKEEPAQRAGDT